MNPYNPLDIENLGLSVLTAMLAQAPAGLDTITPFLGTGVYAIYYTGEFNAYQLLAATNRDGKFENPIYVGKAIPAGARRGITVATQSRQLSARIREHAASIRSVENLRIEDFWVRYLVVEPIWIPLGEQLLISRHAPLWNAVVDGFGNHDPGTGRISGLRPRWDTLHPGRSWASKYPARPTTPAQIANDAAEYLRQRLQV